MQKRDATLYVAFAHIRQSLRRTLARGGFYADGAACGGIGEMSGCGPDADSDVFGDFTNANRRRLLKGLAKTADREFASKIVERALCARSPVIVKVIVRDSDDRGFQRVQIFNGFSRRCKTLAERRLNLRSDSLDAHWTFQVDDTELEMVKERSDQRRLSRPTLAGSR